MLSADLPVLFVFTNSLPFLTTFRQTSLKGEAEKEKCIQRKGSNFQTPDFLQEI